MKAFVFLVASMAISITCPSTAKDFVVGPEIEEPVFLSMTKSGLSVRSREKSHGTEMLLTNFQIIPREASPNYFIVSGRVVSDNARIPMERVLVRVGDAKTKPSIAGMTNADGEFKFELRMGERLQTGTPQVNKGFDGYLYLGGNMYEDLEESEAIILRYDFSKLKTFADRRNQEGEQARAAKPYPR